MRAASHDDLLILYLKVTSSTKTSLTVSGCASLYCFTNEGFAPYLPRLVCNSLIKEGNNDKT